MFNWIRNIIGRMNGLSYCLKCNGTWNWKKPHMILVNNNRSIFPLCEECYHEVSPEERLYWCKTLFKSWYTKDHVPEQIDWERVSRIVGVEVKLSYIT